MKADYTYIAIVLDRSGSMESIEKATVDGFNEFINKQKELTGDVDVHFVRFDHEYEHVFTKPLAEVPALTTIEPRGMTALHDAVGRTIDSVGFVLSNMAEEDRPEKVIVLVLTDGGENSSKDYTAEKVAALVKQQTETYSWQFMFLGANQDAVLTAQQYAIPAGRALTYNAGDVGTMNVFKSAANLTLGVRGVRGPQGPQGYAHLAFSDDDRLEALKEDE